jgi:hypothetical protein
MAESIVVPGKFDIYCAFPSTSHATLVKLGVNVDDLECPLEVISAPVYGDAHGGRAGDPIEDQYLGERSRASLELTVWDKAVAALLRTHGGILTTPGNIPETAIGALMRRDHCFRFCFIPVRDATLAVNFPCVKITRNTLIAGGTKHAALRLELEMHRAPIGHIGNKDNILYDSDITGVPSPG